MSVTEDRAQQTQKIVVANNVQITIHTVDREKRRNNSQTTTDHSDSNTFSLAPEKKLVE